MLALVLSATIVLTGLVWISVKPKTLVPVSISLNIEPLTFSSSDFNNQILLN